MPDDNQTAAAGLIANQTVTEPRSAVEAASDPSHGGSAPTSQFTVKSAANRLHAVVGEAEGALAEFEDMVCEMIGGDRAKQQNPSDKLPPVGGVVGDLHVAAAGIEGLFARMSALVKRAKAAHG
jgi:hypothetical protein